MKIELDREDIIKEIDENYRNDSDFLFDIVDNATTSWEPVRELVKRLIEALKTNNEIADVVGQSEQLKAFSDYAQKRMWEDGDKDLSEFVYEFLSL